MDFYQRLVKLERIHRSILTRSTGTPAQLASKVNIARRTLYEYLDQLKSLGAEIAYSRTIQSYYYVNDFNFQLRIKRNNSD
ncbi:MAG: HTH domain-containing protein [Bacteroidales bacterium]|nr:HTH domain-containing protein [Bacteroidales bacterium]MBS3776437.1 HTH domain-containing protein [Bacteroidales bacterium]